MTTKTNYENNIFYLQTLLKTARNGLSLEIDAEYFQGKILDDILFLSSSLSAMYASLKANTHLIKKTNYLRSLLRTKRDFTELVQNILEKKLPLAYCLEAELPKLKTCMAEQKLDIDEIKAQVENRGQNEGLAESDIISSEEFHFLLKPNDEQEA